MDVGATSVNFHMLNKESRKYFNRAFISSSSSFSHYAYPDRNHLDQMKKCTKIDDEKKLIAFLKTVDSDGLDVCQTFSFTNANAVPWAPTIESAETVGAFKTKLANEMYSEDPAVMDTLFSFNSQVLVYCLIYINSSDDPFLSDFEPYFG